MTASGVTGGIVRTANVSGLGAVERELAAMHRAMLRAGGEPARGVRLSLMTLVVACNDDAEADRAAGVVAAIASRHPARALLVVARRDDPDGIEADMRLECSVAGGPDNQVCAEIVRLRVGGDPARHMGSIVGPLLLADVPVRLWVAGAPPLEQALDPDNLELVDRLVLDTDAYADAAGTLRALAAATRRGGGRVPIADLAWMRLEPWRELVARTYDAAPRRGLLGAIESVSVEASAEATARLTAGWLASRLGLDPGRIALDLVPGGPPLGRLTLRSSGAAPGTVDIHLDGDTLRTRIDTAGGSSESSVPLAAPGLEELVGAALQEGGEDSVYLEAARAAAGPAW